MKKIAVGITGASGAIYAKVLLQKLRQIPEADISIVMSKNAEDVWKYELGNEEYKSPGTNFLRSMITLHLLQVAAAVTKHLSFVLAAWVL